MRAAAFHTVALHFVPAVALPSELVEATPSDQVAVARRGVLASLAVAPLPAKALFGIFEGPTMKAYSVVDTFNVSFPADFQVIKEDTAGLILQGDRIQPLEQMTAAGKVVAYSDLATGLGPNITEVGEKLAEKRPLGKALLVETKVDPTGQGLDAYQFEFQNDKLHELWYVAVIRRGSENVFCNVAMRTPNLLWETRKDLFQSIIASFTPLEPQAARKVELAVA